MFRPHGHGAWSHRFTGVIRWKPAATEENSIDVRHRLKTGYSDKADPGDYPDPAEDDFWLGLAG